MSNAGAETEDSRWDLDRLHKIIDDGTQARAVLAGMHGAVDDALASMQRAQAALSHAQSDHGYRREPNPETAQRAADTAAELARLRERQSRAIENLAPRIALAKAVGSFSKRERILAGSTYQAPPAVAGQEKAPNLFGHNRW